MSHSSRITAVAIVVAASSCLAACTVSTPSQATASLYACDDTVVVSGKPVAWSAELYLTAPTEATHTSRSRTAWDKLVRSRNHFGGADSTLLPSGTAVVIPRSCNPSETAPKQTPTLSVKAAN